jgi:hypothetical protein
MGIAPLQLPSSQAFTPDVSSTLSGIGEVFKNAQLTNNRQQTLSQIGQNGFDANKAITALAANNDLEGASKLAAIQKAIAPETAPDLQAYKLYQAQGGNLPFLDFKTKLAAAGATRVNNSTNVNTGEKEFDKAVGKDYGEVFTGINKAGRDSVGAINNLNLMEGLTKNPNFYSGSGGEMVTQAKRLATSLGVADADSAAPNELFTKLSQKAVLDSAGGSLGNGFSNADRSFIQGTTANIGNTPEGNRQIIGIARRVEQRKQEIAKFARDYASKHGGRVDAGFDDALAAWTEQNPAFPQLSQPATSAAPASSGNKTKGGIGWSVVQ